MGNTYAFEACEKWTDDLTVLASQSIPAGVQQRVVDAYGTAGIVEIVALCGLYTIMGFMVAAFDIPLEPSMPKPSF